MILEMQERIQRRIPNDDYPATIPTISTIWSTLRCSFLTTETYTTISTTTGFNKYSGCIYQEINMGSSLG